MPGPAEKTYAIHPAIGVARLGNAEADPADPSTYYLGPESPYEISNAGQAYKAGGKLKKQTQRFRIYEYADGKATREITLAEKDVAKIVWTVHLSNRKAALDVDAEPGSVAAPGISLKRFWPADTRNKGVTGGPRKDLCIDPGPQSVGTPGTERELSSSITFKCDREGSELETPKINAVTLGKLYLERSGRLLVFAASGISQGLDTKGEFSSSAGLDEFVNNSCWYDDSADGRVQAEVTFTDGTSVSLDQPEQAAWVLCTAPKYTPGFDYFTTIHDVAIDALRNADDPVPRPSFTRDIYPVLRSVTMLQWVSSKGSLGHGNGKRGDYLQEDRLRLISDNDPSPKSVAYQARQSLFARVRNPDHAWDDPQPKQMPNLSDEVVAFLKDKNNDPQHYDIGAVTRLQYKMLEKWRDGDFAADFTGAPAHVPLDKLDVTEQPAALDLAALQGTAGTPLYPGIESWLIVRSAELYAAPLRIAGNVNPGDLTMGNALPWQADYLDCTNSWWPVQRPTNVTRNGQPLQSWEPRAWRAGADEGTQYTQMVQNWWQLGFVISKNNGLSYEESERADEVPGE